MKTQILLFAFILINSIFVSTTHGTIIIRHQLMPEDVSELNILGNAFGLASKPGISGWPVSTEQNTYITGVNFIVKDTLKKIEGKDEIWTIRLKLKEINLAGQNLSGTLPDLSFNDLEIFNLGFNHITGNIPVLYFPKCKQIILNRNEFTGPLPNFDLPELTYIGFISNKLSGPIPNLNLPKLNTLFLGDNQFEGEIPNFNLPALKFLYLTKNKLTGNIPNFNLPMLQDLDIEENKLTGTIPLFNFPNAWNIRLTANQLTGPVPNFNMPKLSNLALGQNKLTGTIPKFNMPNLILLNLKENQLEGEFDNSGLPILIDLYIQKNMITGIPHLKAKSPNLEIVDVTGCNLKFEHIEPNMDIKNFKYTGQQKIETYQSQSGTLITLSVKDSAPNNQYKWRKIKDGVSTIVPDAVSDKLVITVEPGVAYFCSITNTKVPGLTINSKTVNINSCINFGLFAFCLENGTWEKKENNTASASGKIYINDLAVFEGSVTLDTLNLAMQANGKLYVQNIPLPGGGTGNFLLTEGEHNLKLLGTDGVITNFLNSKLTQEAVLFDIPVKIDSMQFLKRHDTLGVRITSTITTSFLWEGCGDTPGNTDIALKNFEVTNFGVFLEGFDVANLGFWEKCCIKKLIYSYNSKNDIMTIGGEIKLPFIEGLGCGLKLEKGKVDSIAILAELNKALLPIKPPVIALKGAYGHIAGLTKIENIREADKLDIKLGGIFSPLLDDNLYRFTADARINWPKLFMASFTGQMFRPPLTDLPFQYTVGGEFNWKVSEYQFVVDFKGNFGTLDEKIWLMDIKGKTLIDVRWDPIRVTLNEEGVINLPKLTDNGFFNWLDTHIDFPVKLGAASFITNENQKLKRGVIFFEPIANQRYELGYTLDFSKKMYEPGYITFTSEIDPRIFNNKNKSGLLTDEVTKTFELDKNTDFALIEIRGPENAPKSSLKNPSGKIYSSSFPEDKVLSSKSVNGKESFWSIHSPKAGNWSVTVENMGENDSIIVYRQKKRTEFDFTVNQSGSVINIVWDASKVDSGQIVNIMFDEDMNGFDGFNVAGSDAKTGKLSFILDESYSKCKYYICGQLEGDYWVSQKYSGMVIENPLTTLAPPTNFTSKFNTETGEFEFDWDLNPSPVIEGYIISVTDEEGKDSVYAILNKNRTDISLYIENFETKTAKIESFSIDWKIGCPSVAIELSTSTEDFGLTGETVNKLKVYPNPTTGNCTVRYFVPGYSKCEIAIFDINGRKIAHPFTGFQPAGFHQIDFQYDNLPNGIYIIQFKNDFETITAKSVLSR